MRKIKEILNERKMLRLAYEAADEALHQEAEAVREARGYKAKVVSWEGYREAGRDREYRTPYGDI